MLDYKWLSLCHKSQEYSELCPRKPPKVKLTGLDGLGVLGGKRSGQGMYDEKTHANHIKLVWSVLRTTVVRMHCTVT